MIQTHSFETKENSKIKPRFNEINKILFFFLWYTIQAHLSSNPFVMNFKNLCREGRLVTVLKTQLVDKSFSIDPNHVLPDYNSLGVVMNRT